MLEIRRYHLAVDDKCYVCGKDMKPCCDGEPGDGGDHVGSIWHVEPLDDIYYTGFCCTLQCAMRWYIGWEKLMEKRMEGLDDSLY